MMPETQVDKLEGILLSLARIEKALNIVPDLETIITNFDSSLKDYQKFAKDELKLEEITIENQRSTIFRFLNQSKGIINKQTVKEYLDSNESPSWKTNQIKALRRYIRDFLKLGNWIKEFDFSHTTTKIKQIPTDQQLIEFYNVLPHQTQIVFLILFTSGLRLGEVMSLRVMDIDAETNMVDASEIHSGKTKHSWISFITQQAFDHMLEYLDQDQLENPDSMIFLLSKRSVQQAFKNASLTIGVDINPHLLRSVFTEKCAQANIAPKYIDAFCGRIQHAVLDKHYTDYSPNALRQQYDKVESYLTLG